MKSFSYEEIGAVTATLNADPNVTEGCVVKVIDNGVVAACDEGDLFFGVAGTPRDGVVSVQVHGFVRVPCSSDVFPGAYGLVADGKGGVRFATNMALTGVPVFAVDVSYEEKTAVICL